MGTQYTFYDYVNTQGENEILNWLNSAAGLRGKNKIKFQVAFKERLLGLEGTPASEWRRPPAATLFDDCAGLFEVRIEFKNVQFRLIGFHDPGQKTGTLIFGAKEVNYQFVPSTTCQQAQEIRRLIESNPSPYRRIHDWS